VLIDNQPGRTQQKGFSLVELIVGMVILSLMVVSMIPFLTNSEIYLIGVDKRLKASAYATSIIETVKARTDEITACIPYNYISSANDEFEFCLVNDYSVKIPTGLDIKNTRLEIKPYDYEYSDRLAAVNVIVTWFDNAREQSYELSTIVTVPLNEEDGKI